MQTFVDSVATGQPVYPRSLTRELHRPLVIYVVEDVIELSAVVHAQANLELHCLCMVHVWANMAAEGLNGVYMDYRSHYNALTSTRQVSLVIDGSGREHPREVKLKISSCSSTCRGRRRKSSRICRYRQVRQ